MRTRLNTEHWAPCGNCECEVTVEYGVGSAPYPGMVLSCGNCGHQGVVLCENSEWSVEWENPDQGDTK